LEDDHASQIQSPAEGRRAALAAKRGEIDERELKGTSREMYNSMSEKQLEEFASTRREGLPEHIQD
jgi:hypothetical protein